MSRQQQRRAHARTMQKLGTLEHHFDQVLRATEENPHA